MSMSEFKKFVQGALDYGITSYEDTTTERKGGLVGNDVPPSPAEFHKQLTDREEYSTLNDWSLDKNEADSMIAFADNKYIQHYASWVNTPLAFDAHPNLVAWQKAARAAAATDPLITTDFKTIEQRVAALEAKVK